MLKPKVINLYGGPGSGKSTTAAALFAELKYRHRNVEYIQEYAKDATWERRGQKIFAAQEYIFAKQHFRLSRVASEVDFVITDSPLLLSWVYTPTDYALPSLRTLAKEAYDQYDNLDFFIIRNKPFQQAGRNQTEDEAKALDNKIRQMIIDAKINVRFLTFDRECVGDILDTMKVMGWLQN